MYHEKHLYSTTTASIFYFFYVNFGQILAFDSLVMDLKEGYTCQV
jgi:hypothetical protein